jgi:hypothetical protein
MGSGKVCKSLAHEKSRSEKWGLHGSAPVKQNSFIETIQ